MFDTSWMFDGWWSVRARVRHEPDRSYTVFVEGPDGEAQVGTTSRTRRIWEVACEGADRLWGHPAGRTTWENLELSVPRPPYGRDGQWVRVVATDEDAGVEELSQVGLAGSAHWFEEEHSWMLSGPSVEGVYPGEYLDFDPVVSAVEVERMREHRHRRHQG